MSRYVEGDLPYSCNNGNNGHSGWNDGSWSIGLALVGGLFGGWGNGGGFGFGGGNRGGGYGGVADNYVLATDFATIERKLDGVNNGLCDGFYAQNTNMLNGFAAVQSALCQGFNGLQQTAMQGFHGVDNAVCTLGYQTQAGFNALANQVASCCCDLKQINLENRYLNEKQTCDILAGQNAQTRAILDFLTTEKISALQAENSGLKAQISNDRQSAFIIDALAPKCPAPAYVVQPPQQVTFATNCCGNTAYAGYNNGGCGCGCN